MPVREITLTTDEHFHGGLTLMAMEPVSGYHVLEERAEKRDEATWGERLLRRLLGWKVRLRQVTSDEAKGLKALAHGQEAHHSPDLFHAQRELSKAMMLPLLRQVTQAEGKLKKASDALAKRIAQQTEYWQNRRRPGRPPAFQARIREAEAGVQAVQAVLDATTATQREATSAIRQLSFVYHPFALDIGAPQTPAQVVGHLEAVFATIDRVAREASLGAASRDRIEKARRLVPDMVGTIAFYGSAVTTAMGLLNVSPETIAVIHTTLLPGLYLQRVAARTRRAADRAVLRLRTRQEIIHRCHRLTLIGLP